MLRARAVVATTVLVVAVSGPALAQEPLEGLQPVIDFLSAQSETDLEMVLTAAPTGGALVTDPVLDFEHVTGEQPRFTPNYMDIRRGAFFDLQPGPVDLFAATNRSALWTSTGPREIDPPGHPAFFTYTGRVRQDGSQYQGGALLFEIGLREPPPSEPGGNCDFAVWVDDAAREIKFQNLADFPLDPGAGKSLVFGLRLTPTGGGVPTTFSLAVDETGVFQPADTDVRAFVVGNTVGIIVPRLAVGALATVNYHAVCSTEGSAVDPATSGADQTGSVPAGLGEAGVVSIVETPVTATPTVPETTTSSRPAPAVVPEVAAETGVGTVVWAPAVAAAVLLGSVAYWVFTRRRNPEERALAVWRKAERALAKAEEETEPLIVACLEAGAVLEELEHERVDLCRVWPPVCLEDSESDVGDGLTTQDQHFRRMALGELWADYQEGRIGVEEVEARWPQVNTPEFRDRMRESNEAYGETLAQLDDEIAGARAAMEPACAQGAPAAARVDTAREAVVSARQAYLDTLETPPAVPLPAATWLTEECRQVSSPRVAPDGPVERVRANVGFMLTIGRFAGKDRNLERGERLVLEMEGLLHELQLSDIMREARRAGMHAAWSGHEYEPGIYWVTADGVMRQEPGAVSPPDEEAERVDQPAGPQPLLTPVPSSIGDHATSRVMGWMSGFDTLTMQRTFFHQLITSRPHTIWDCQDGIWRCRERAWRVEIGEPMRNRGEVRWFSAGSPGRKAQFETEVNRLAWVATGVVTRDLRRLMRWRATHVAGPCR